MQVQPDAITQVLGLQGYHVTDYEVSHAEIDLCIEPDQPRYVCPRCRQMLLSYLLKEQFRALLEPTDVKVAMDRLADWFADVLGSGIQQLIKFVHQCGRWFEGLMSYFKHGVTNALWEAMNSKIALMIKLANGFRNRDYFMLKIYQQCRELG